MHYFNGAFCVEVNGRCQGDTMTRDDGGTAFSSNLLTSGDVASTIARYANYFPCQHDEPVLCRYQAGNLPQTGSTDVVTFTNTERNRPYSSTMWAPGQVNSTNFRFQIRLEERTASGAWTLVGNSSIGSPTYTVGFGTQLAPGNYRWVYKSTNGGGFYDSWTHKRPFY